jgi:pilus assembly protein CpaB
MRAFPRIVRSLLVNRSAWLAVFAIAFGLLAVTGARGYIAERIDVERARLAPQGPRAEIVVAKSDLAAGATIDADTMAIRSLPAEFVPGQAIRPEGFDRWVGARIAQPMRSGEPLLASLVEPARESAFSARIRPGIRGLTIQVDEVNSVSGMLQPGDRIDLMFSVRLPAGPGSAPSDEMTAPLMQDLLVLATGSRVAASRDAPVPGRNFTAITVEVSPDQAQRLIVAQRAGRLTATLRHPDDRGPVRTGALDVRSLLGLRAPAGKPAAAPSVPEVIVGGRGGALRVDESPVRADSVSPQPGPAAVSKGEPK